MNAHSTAVASVISGLGTSCLAFSLPDGLVSFSIKVGGALLIGLLTGMGTAMGSMLVKRLFTKKEKK